MGNKFFEGWALWEKLVFVLACSVVITILAGCVKLWYDHHRMRKFVKNPQERTELNREKSIIRSLSRRSAKAPMIEKKPRVVNDGVEVPFGIRAIESGIEVDGVWISRSNTPVQLPSRNSSGNFMYGGFPNNSSTDFTSARTDLMMTPSPASRPHSRVLDRSFSSDSMVSDPASADPMTPAGAVRYPPHSYMRYENTKHFRKSRALSSSDNLSRPVSGYDSSQSNRSSSIDTTPRNNSTSSDDAASPQQDIPMPQPRAVNYAALDMLQAHRLSHAAETGQLVPRTRRAGQSGDWAGIANFAPIVSGEIVNFSLPRNSTDLTTPPGSSSSMKSNPFNTPSTEKSSVDWGEPQSATTEGSSKSYEMLPRVRRTSSSFSGSSFSVSRPESTVLREVNSGFSVLKPGTLNAESQQFGGFARNRSAFPPVQRRRSHSVSMENEKGEKRRSRRLQKKRRPSESSILTDRSSMSMESDFQAPSTVFSGSEISRPPSALEIAQGAEFERNSIVKFSFDVGQRPPSAMEVAKGAQVDAKAKYKF